MRIPPYNGLAALAAGPKASPFLAVLRRFDSVKTPSFSFITSLCGDGEGPQPGFKVADIKGARLEHPHHLGIDLLSHGQIIVSHSLLSQLAVEAVELIQTRCERGHHVAAGALPLMPVDVVAQGLVEYRLKLAALAFCDLAQRGQHIGRGLGGKLFAENGGHGQPIHDLS